MGGATLDLGALRADLEACADPERAAQMAGYMKGHFAFFGLAMRDTRRIAKPFVLAGRAVGADVLLDTADELWEQDEREFQYVGVDLLRRWVATLEAGHLHRIASLIRTKSWWDTVDALAAHVVGGLVAAHRELVTDMDRWIDDPDLWIARSAILHQLDYGERTDADRLFDYVDRRAADTEFFIRKACGWALRQYARTDPDAVRKFVELRGDRLSGLTRREATKHL